MTQSVTLQISLVPADGTHAVHTLPHQLRQWGGQVAEIVFTLDGKRDTGDARSAALRSLLNELCQEHPHAHIDEVDYSAEARERVSRRLFGGRPVPAHDYRLGPIYPLLYGLDAARQDCVLHTDSDMLFGGGSQQWVAEGLALLASRPDALSVSPLPGPPTPDGRLPDRIAQQHMTAHRVQSTAGRLQPEREPHGSLAYRFHGFSWRVFLMDRARLVARVAPIRLRRATPRELLVAALNRADPWTTLELSLARLMQERGLFRVDFLGAHPGMWSLHPPHRSPEFYRDLPTLIQRIEAGDVPAGQRGDFNINDSFVDWTSAREARSHARRRRHLRALSGRRP